MSFTAINRYFFVQERNGAAVSASCKVCGHRVVGLDKDGADGALREHVGLGVRPPCWN